MVGTPASISLVRNYLEDPALAATRRFVTARHGYTAWNGDSDTLAATRAEPVPAGFTAPMPLVSASFVFGKAGAVP
jgi:hypothetical protein